MDNQFWIFVHVYIVKNWHPMPILLNLERIVNGGTHDNLTSMIIRFLAVFGDISNIVVCFGVDSVTIFQGLKIGVTVQLVSKHCPFVVRIHCMTHRGNLIVQTLSSLTLVVKIEGFFSSMYTYYN